MATESEQIKKMLAEGSKGGPPLHVPGNPELTEMVQSQQAAAQSRQIQLEEPETGVTPENLEIDYTPTKTVPQRYAKEQAFYGSNLDRSVTNAEDMIASYAKIKNDLETTGSSAKLEDIKTLLQTESSEATKGAVLNIVQDNDIPLEQRSAILQQYLKDRSTDVYLAEEYFERTFADRPEDTEQEISDKEFDLSFIQDRLNYTNEIQAISNRHIMRLDNSLWGSILGFLELIVPYSDGIPVQIAKEAAFGSDSWGERIFNVIFSGEAKVDLRESLERMPYEARREASKTILDAISGLPGADVKKLYLIQDLISSPEYATWQRGLDDFIGIVDTALVGTISTKLAKAAAKPLSYAFKSLLKVHPKSPLDVTKLASTDAAAELSAKALLDDSGQVADAIGVTKEQIAADYVLPKFSDEVLEDAPANVLEALEDIENTFKDVAEQISTHGLNYSDAEKLASQGVINESLETSSKLFHFLEKSVIIDDGERYAGLALYGRSPKRGFATLKGAQDRAELNGLLPEETIFFAKDPSTGKIVKIEEFAGETNEYFIGRKFNHVYNPTDKAILGEDAVTPLGRGKYAGYFLDIGSRFNELIASSFLRSKDVGSAIETRMLDFIRKDIGKLSDKKKLNVFQALEDGSKQQEVFPTSILRSRYKMSDKEIKAYFSYRKVSDILWSLTNKSYHKKLTEKGMLRILAENSETPYYAKPIKDRGAIKSQFVYDPKIGDIRKLTDDELDNIYKNGGSVARLNNNITIGKNRVSQILVDNKVAKYHALPKNPLGYIPGYIQRTYKEYYYVDKVPGELIVDGVKITDPAKLVDMGTTTSAYSTKAGADAAAKRLSEATGIKHVARPGREFDIDPMVQDFQIHQRSLKSTRTRGTRLSGAGDEALADIEDPIESLLRTARAVSNHVAMQDVLASMRRAWEVSYGHMVDGGKLPKNINDIDKRLAANSKEYKNAVALKQLMDTVEGVPAKTDAAYQHFMFDLAEMFEKVSPGAAKVAREGTKASPTSAIRKLPSHLYLALNPLRQIVVQSSQLAQHALLEPKYLASGKAARELAAINMMAVSRGKPFEKQAMKIAAKTFGVSEEEFDVIVKTYFDKSGLPYSVDANWFVEGIVKDIHETTLKSPAKKAAGIPAQAYKKVVSLGKRGGYNVGEFQNLTGSWLLARKRWIDANPDIAHKWFEKQYADIIAANARKISYAMTQPGTFAYQKGILSIPLQFVAVPHKALLSVSTSHVWTPLEKAKIFAANLGLFGAYGVGLDKAFDLLQEEVGFELSPEELQAIKGGIVDLAFNKLLSYMFDEEGQDPTSLALSKSIAPLSEGAVPFSNVLTNLYDGEWGKAALGPAYNILHFQDGRIGRAIQDMAAIAEAPELDTRDKVIGWLESIASVGSGYSNYVKYRLAKKTEQIISSRGNVTFEEVTAAEAVGVLFGAQLTEEVDTYRILKKEWNEEEEFRNAVTQRYEALYRIHKKYYNKDDANYRLGLAQHNAIMAAFEPHERQAAAKIMMELDRKNLRTTGDSLTYIISKAAIDDDPRERMRNIIRGARIDENRKRIYEEALNKGLDEELF